MSKVAAMIYAGNQGHSRHWVYPITIEGDGATATVFAYLMVLRAGAIPDATVILTGLHWDKLQKIDGRWRIVEKKASGDPQPEHSNITPQDVLLRRHADFINSLVRQTGS